MSIRLLAKDLYQSQKEVERLEKALESAPFDLRVGLEAELRQARAQMLQLKRALDGRIGR